MGHTYAVALQVTLTSYALFIVANTLSFGIGCYLFGITVTKEIKGILQTADKKLSLKTEQSTAMKRFSELVKWHSFIKQLSKQMLSLDFPVQNFFLLLFRLITDFSSLFQPFFISVFMWSTLGICIIMLMVQLQIVEWKISFSNRLIWFFCFLLCFNLISICRMKSNWWCSWCYFSIHAMHSGCFVLFVNYVNKSVTDSNKWIKPWINYIGHCIRLICNDY